MQIAANAVQEARKNANTVVILDTAGRLHIDEAMMSELQHIEQRVKPQEVLLVADAMTGQDAVHAAEEFHRAVNITGMILTKMDGDARGGAALSIRQVTGVPIKYMGTGEKTDALESLPPRPSGAAHSRNGRCPLADREGAGADFTRTRRRSSRKRCGPRASIWTTS